MEKPIGTVPAGEGKPSSPVQKIKFSKQRELPLEMRTLIRRLQKNYPFFADMSEDEVQRFLPLCRRVSYEEGQAVFRAGEADDTFYLVIAGEIVLREGEEDAPRRLGPGTMFGEAAMLGDTPRAATALAGERTLLFSISRRVLVSRMPALAFRVVVSIAKDLSERVRAANAIIRGVEEASAPEAPAPPAARTQAR